MLFCVHTHARPTCPVPRVLTAADQRNTTQHCIMYTKNVLKCCCCALLPPACLGGQAVRSALQVVPWPSPALARLQLQSRVNLPLVVVLRHDGFGKAGDVLRRPLAAHVPEDTTQRRKAGLGFRPSQWF